MAKLFVWDFHGVLEKDHQHSVVDVTNMVLDEFGFDARLTLEVCEKFYGRKWHMYFEHLCPQADKETIKAMVYRGVEISDTSPIAFKHIKPNDYAHEVLEKVKQAGHENLIISNTEPGVLDKFINAVDIAHLIDHKIGVDSHRRYPSGKNAKIPLLKEFLNKKEYDKIIAIGDLDTDIELGKAIGATTYLVLKSYNQEVEADYQISDLREVLKEI